MSVYTPASLLRIAQILRCISIAPISIFSGALAAPPSRMLNSRASASVWNTCARVRARGYFAVREIGSSAKCTILPAFESHWRATAFCCAQSVLVQCSGANLGATSSLLAPIRCGAPCGCLLRRWRDSQSWRDIRIDAEFVLYPHSNPPPLCSRMIVDVSSSY
ncbi:hypothetical protein B0H13DRAFT_1879875 [Mycena leptocephala]|nr:hypothetical protein B0H13DRAFT_1879875 [Mycena leptocephala]